MTPIESLNFSARTYHVLKKAKIDTVEQLRQLTDDELMYFWGLGERCLEEIHEKLGNRTITNGERIRTMSDKDLATFIHRATRACNEYDCDSCPIGDENCPDLIGWLKQPVEDA